MKRTNSVHLCKRDPEALWEKIKHIAKTETKVLQKLKEKQEKKNPKIQKNLSKRSKWLLEQVRSQKEVEMHRLQQGYTMTEHRLLNWSKKEQGNVSQLRNSMNRKM